MAANLQWTLSDEPRNGDHICYYTDLTRFRTDYPEWELTTSLDDIFSEMAMFLSLPEVT